MNLDPLKQEILSDQFLRRLSNLVKEKGIPLFLVGGYIRDLFLASASPQSSLPKPFLQEKKDYDFALPKTASSFIPQLEEALGVHFFKVGKDEKETVTYRTVKKDISIDLTFLQGSTIDEDLRRRDFTINAIAYSLAGETFHWVEGALEDVEKRLIRAVSGRSLDQDPLRMFRAIRYLCTLDGFTLDENLNGEISSKRQQILSLPGERVKVELDQILASSRAAVGIRLLFESGLLLALMPELRGLEDLGQSQHHHLDVLSHTLLIVQKIGWVTEWIASKGRRVAFKQEDLLSLSYACLFHDLGKQDTFSTDEKERVHFYHHESFSCQRAEGIMERLRFPNVLRDRVLRLIKNHMRILNLSRETKENALRRLVNQIGNEIPLLVVHTLADKEASRGILSWQTDQVAEEHCLRILDLFQKEEIVHPSPLITGLDVMALGYRSGPRVGQVLNFVRQKQVEGEIETRDEALKMLRDEFGGWKAAQHFKESEG